ncbi:unnamed protein product [marine sediment metagenome]|uniref:Uncharacterized protein n=1 Tax=marine sediment metagenome TaxID=412755 RepID=X1RYH3_9ZZZZ
MSTQRVKPLIMMSFNKENWLDFEKMREVYGEYALFKDKYLDEIMGLRYARDDEVPAAMLDYSKADRLIAAEEKRDARREGNMIYQRGKV